MSVPIFSTLIGFCFCAFFSSSVLALIVAPSLTVIPLSFCLTVTLSPPPPLPPCLSIPHLPSLSRSPPQPSLPLSFSILSLHSPSPSLPFRSKKPSWSAKRGLHQMLTQVRSLSQSLSIYQFLSFSIQSFSFFVHSLYFYLSISFSTLTLPSHPLTRSPCPSSSPCPFHSFPHSGL
jgi:hypothetical protein